MKTVRILLLTLVWMSLLVPNVSALTSHPGITTTNPSGAPGISTTGLLRSYDFETFINGNMKDFSTFADNAVPAGGVIVGDTVGQFNASTHFDGTNDNLAGTAPVTPVAFTVAIWLRPLISNPADGRIPFALRRDGSLFIGYGAGLAGCAVSATKRFVFVMGGSADLCTNTDQSLNAWHSVIAILDGNLPGATKTLRVDGNSVSNTIASPPPLWAFLDMGSQGGGFVLNGDIDELAIWNRTLSLSEISIWEMGPPSVSVIATSTFNLLLFVLAVWLVLLGIGFARVTPMLFLATFVGMNLAYQAFLVSGDFIVPIVIAAVNLILLAYTIETFMKEKKGT